MDRPKLGQTVKVTRLVAPGLEEVGIVSRVHSEICADVHVLTENGIQVVPECGHVSVPGAQIRWEELSDGGQP